MKEVVYGVYFKGRLVYWSESKMGCQRYVGRHQISCYIGPINRDQLNGELDGIRSQGSSRYNKTSDSSQG